MPKYGVVTYKSRKQSRNITTTAQNEFDLALAAKSDKKKTGNCSKTDSERAGMSQVKVKRADKSVDTNKKRKLNPLLEDDLFGFTGSDPESSKDLASQRTKSPSKRKSPTKSGSQECITKRGSPFKVNSSLKNRSSPLKSNSLLKSNLKSPRKNSPKKQVKTVQFESRSTDDEAYGSSQDANVASTDERDGPVDDERPAQKQVCLGCCFEAVGGTAKKYQSISILK